MTAQPKNIIYGRLWPEGTTTLQAALTMYRHTGPGDDRFGYFKDAWSLRFPHLINTYNSWTDWILKEFCHQSKVGGGVLSILGASGTGKSFTVGHMLELDFTAAPEETVTVTASDTLPGLAERVWKYVKLAHRESPYDVGRLIRSKPEMIVSPGEMGSVQAVALDNDPESEKLKGFHPPRLRIVIDEATAISQSAFNNWQNWISAGKEFILIGMSNFRGYDNLCAKISEPLGGWNSIDFEKVTRWPTAVGGVAILLDALRSPVYLNPALKTVLPFLKTKEEVDEIIYGSATKAGLGPTHNRVMQYVRSIPVPAEGESTVLTQKMLTKGGAMQRAKYAGWGREKLLALDPAFVGGQGGDGCILTPGYLGHETDGTQVLEAMDQISIPLDSMSKTPTEYQILDYVVKYCMREGIDPACFAMDACGQGRGLGSIFQYEWSDKIMLLNPGASASLKVVDWQLSKNNRACDLYDRLVTELWLDVKEFVETSQLRNIPKEAAIQFCTRRIDTARTKVRLETKPEYKLRTTGLDSVSGSPDQADSYSYFVHLAQAMGFRLANRKRTYEDSIPEDKRTPHEIAVAEWVAERERQWKEQINSGGAGADVALAMDYTGDIVD